MKKKIFAIALALCMVFTMMPSMGFAEEESAEPLYAIWLKDGETPTGGTINSTQIDGIMEGMLDIDLGYPREVQYLCYKENDRYIVLNPNSASVTGDDLIIKRNEENNFWQFRIDGKKGAGSIGTIRVTGVTTDDKTYSMKYIVKLPGIGAYTSTDFNSDSLLLGEELSYKDLGEEQDGWKTVYFAVNTDEEVKTININGDRFSKENIKPSYEVKTKEVSGKKFSYLEVQVSSNIISEEFEVVATIGENEEPWRYGFKITGNVLYRIPDNGDYSLFGIVSTEGNANIRITPIDDDYCYFGVPTGTDGKFVIVKPEVSSESEGKICLEKRSDEYPAYRVFAGTGAKTGETYYIRAVYDEVEYKIPVHYALPDVGAYTYDNSGEFNLNEINEENLIKGNMFGYTEVRDEEKDGMKTFYIVSNVDAGEAKVKLEVEDGSYPEGLLQIESHESEGNTPAYLKIKVSRDVYYEKINVKMFVSEGEGSEAESWGNWDFWITGRLLYQIGFNGEDPNYQEGALVNTTNCNTEIQLSPIGGEYCYFAVPTENPEVPNQYKIVKIDKTKLPGVLRVSSNDKNAAYDISAKGDAKLPNEYFIYATYDNVEYKIPVHYDLPRVGAYTYTGDTSFDGTQINEDTLIKNYEFRYSQIRVPADEEGWKTIYFVSNIDADGGIVKLERVGDSDNISVEENVNSKLPEDGAGGTPAYMKVKVSKNISEEELKIKVTIDYGQWNEDWEEVFRITGDRLYRIYVDENTDLQIEDKIRTDRWDDRIYIEPNQEESVFFGIPTEEDDVYEIVSAKVSNESKEALSLERKGKRNAAYILKSTQNAKKETYYMEASKGGSTYKIPVECGGASSSSGGATYVPADKTLIVCIKDGDKYEPIPLEITDDYGGVEPAAQFFVGEHADRTFYILTTYEGNLTLKELNHYREEIGDAQNVTVSKVQDTYKYLGEDYSVWKIVVNGETEGSIEVAFSGELRTGFAFNGELAKYQIDKTHEPYTKFMWILDENYDEPNYEQYSNSTIIACTKKPTKEVYSSREDLDNIVCSTKNLNLSKSLTDDANAVFVIHPIETELHARSAIESSYMVQGSGYGRGGNDGGNFQKFLNGEIYKYEKVGKVTIDGTKMQISKATLTNVYGNRRINTVFYLTEASGTVKREGYASICVEKGMNVVIKGASEDAVTIDSDYNIVSEAVGNGQIMSPLSFEKQEDGTYVAFYPEALAETSDEGTGRYTSFNIKLKPGYVIEKITDKDDKMLGFTSSRRFLYSLLDENGQPIYAAAEINRQGWTKGISGSANEQNGNRSIIGVDHCVATYVTDYMDGMPYSRLGSDNSIRLFVDFLTGINAATKEHKAKQQAAYTQYTVYFDPKEDGKQNEIVFHVKKAKIGETINAKNKGSDFSIQTELADMNNIDSEKLAKFLQALDFKGYSVLKVYNMTSKVTTGTNEQGLYNVTIPQSELKQGTDLSDYKVVYFDEEDGTVYPLEVETTYVEGKGIAFTTGHFSHYALLYKPKANPDPPPTPTPGGGAIAPVPSDVTTSGAAGDKVTTAKADVEVTEQTNADGTKMKIADVKVSTDNQKEILKQAKANKSKEIILDVSKDAVKDATKAEVTLDKSFIDSIVKDTDAKLTVKTPFGDKTYTQEELKAMSEAATGSDITVAIEAAAEPTAEEIKAEKIAKAKSGVEKADAKARSSKLKSGSIKIVFNPDAKAKAFIEEMEAQGFTVKYRFYRSTKKSSGYKAMVTKETKSCINKTGKKGMKYFYKVQVRVYDENGKLIAKTALKQCKYASRTWSK